MRKKTWHKQHKAEIDEFWDRFVKLVFDTEEKPESLDNPDFASYYFAMRIQLMNYLPEIRRYSQSGP